MRLVESGVLRKGFGDDLVEFGDSFDFAFDFVAEFHLFVCSFGNDCFGRFVYFIIGCLANAIISLNGLSDSFENLSKVILSFE